MIQRFFSIRRRKAARERQALRDQINDLKEKFDAHERGRAAAALKTLEHLDHILQPGNLTRIESRDGKLIFFHRY